MARAFDNQPAISIQDAIAHLEQAAPADAIAAVSEWINQHDLGSRCSWHVAGQQPPTLRVRGTTPAGDDIRVFHVNAYGSFVSVEFFLIQPAELIDFTTAFPITARIDAQRYYSRALIRDVADATGIAPITIESLARLEVGEIDNADRSKARARHIKYGGVEFRPHGVDGMPVDHRCAYEVLTGERTLAITIAYASGAGSSKRYAAALTAILEHGAIHKATLEGAWVDSSDAETAFPDESNRRIRIDRDGFGSTVVLAAVDVPALRKSLSNRQAEITSRGEKLEGGAWSTARLHLSFPNRLAAARYLVDLGSTSVVDDEALWTEVDQLLQTPVPKPQGKIKPGSKDVTSRRYDRDPDVVAYVLQLADGTCELCGQVGPFERDGRAFLEVHHVIPLGEGGPDTEWNAVAICPNCHRRCHLADDREDATAALYGQVTRLKPFPVDTGTLI